MLGIKTVLYLHKKSAGICGVFPGSATPQDGLVRLFNVLAGVTGGPALPRVETTSSPRRNAIPGMVLLETVDDISDAVRNFETGVDFAQSLRGLMHKQWQDRKAIEDELIRLIEEKIKAEGDEAQRQELQSKLGLLRDELSKDRAALEAEVAALRSELTAQQDTFTAELDQMRQRAENAEREAQTLREQAGKSEEDAKAKGFEEQMRRDQEKEAHAQAIRDAVAAALAAQSKEHQQKMQDAQSRFDAALAEQKGLLDEERQKVTDAEQGLRDASSARSDLEQKHAQELAALQEKLAAAEAQIERDTLQNSESVTAAERMVVDTKAELEKVQGLLDAKEAERARLEQELAAHQQYLKQQLAQKDTAFAKAQKEHGAAQAELVAKLQAQEQDFNARLASTQREKDEAIAAANKEKTEAIAAKDEEAKLAIQAAEAKVQAAEEALATATAELEAAKKEMGHLNRKLEQANNELDALRRKYIVQSQTIPQLMARIHLNNLASQYNRLVASGAEQPVNDTTRADECRPAVMEGAVLLNLVRLPNQEEPVLKGENGLDEGHSLSHDEVLAWTALLEAAIPALVEKKRAYTNLQTVVQEYAELTADQADKSALLINNDADPEGADALRLIERAQADITLAGIHQISTANVGKWTEAISSRLDALKTAIRNNKIIQYLDEESAAGHKHPVQVVDAVLAKFGAGATEFFQGEGVLNPGVLQPGVGMEHLFPVTYIPDAKLPTKLKGTEVDLYHPEFRKQMEALRTARLGIDLGRVGAAYELLDHDQKEAQKELFVAAAMPLVLMTQRLAERFRQYVYLVSHATDESHIRHCRLALFDVFSVQKNLEHWYQQVQGISGGAAASGQVYTDEYLGLSTGLAATECRAIFAGDVASHKRFLAQKKKAKMFDSDSKPKEWSAFDHSVFQSKMFPDATPPLGIKHMSFPILRLAKGQVVGTHAKYCTYSKGSSTEDKSICLATTVQAMFYSLFYGKSPLAKLGIRQTTGRQMYAADIVASLFNASERSGSAKGGRVGLEVASHWELKTTTKEKGFAELQTLRDVYEAIALQLKDMLAGDLEMKQLGAGRPRRRRPKPPGPPAGKPDGQQAVAT